MRPLLALPLVGLVLAGCAKGPANGVSGQYTRLRFTFTMAGDVVQPIGGDSSTYTFQSGYIYLVAIRPLTGIAPINDNKGPVGVYAATNGNPKNGFVEGRPTRYVLYDPTQPTAYQIRKFGTRETTPDDDNPIDLANITTVGAVVQGLDPQTSGFPRQFGFDIYTNDLVDDPTTAQNVTAIQFNIIACNKALLQPGDASGRVADALGNINNLGITGQGYRQVYINTSTGYANSTSTDVEGANDTYSSSGKYDPSLDIVDWTLDVSRP